MSEFANTLEELLHKVSFATSNEAEIVVGEDYDVREEVASLISKSRKDKSVTQKELAISSGVAQANISKIENGAFSASIDTLKKLADGLGMRLVISFEDIEE